MKVIFTENFEKVAKRFSRSSGKPNPLGCERIRWNEDCVKAIRILKPESRKQKVGPWRIGTHLKLTDGPHMLTAPGPGVFDVVEGSLQKLKKRVKNPPTQLMGHWHVSGTLSKGPLTWMLSGPFIRLFWFPNFHYYIIFYNILWSMLHSHHRNFPKSQKCTFYD